MNRQVVIQHRIRDRFRFPRGWNAFTLMAGAAAMLLVAGVDSALAVPERAEPADEMAVPGSADWPPTVGTACASDAGCDREAVCIPDATGAFPGTCYVPKNRYLAVAANSANTGETARRLSVVLTERWCDGQVGGTPCVRNSQCAGIGNAVCEDVPVGAEVLGWFGAPDAKGYVFVQLGPFYTIWKDGQYPIDCGVDALCPANALCDTGLGGNKCKWSADNTDVLWDLVFLGDCHISPMIRDTKLIVVGGLAENAAARHYLIESISQGDDIGNPNNYSTPLDLPTVQHWGDLIGGLLQLNAAARPPEGSAGFLDMAAQVWGFQDRGRTHASWVDIDPQVPDRRLDFLDVLETVRAFKGDPYRFDDPCTCSGLTACP